MFGGGISTTKDRLSSTSPSNSVIVDGVDEERMCYRDVLVVRSARIRYVCFPVLENDGGVVKLGERRPRGVIVKSSYAGLILEGFINTGCS